MCGCVTAACSPPLCQADRRSLRHRQSIAAFMRSNKRREYELMIQEGLMRRAAVLMRKLCGSSTDGYSNLLTNTWNSYHLVKVPPALLAFIRRRFALLVVTSDDESLLKGMKRGARTTTPRKYLLHLRLPLLSD